MTDTVTVPETESVRSIDDLIAEALRSRPDLAQASIQVENSQISLKGSLNALRPELDVVGTVQNGGLSGDINPVSVALTPGTSLYPGGYGTALEMWTNSSATKRAAGLVRYHAISGDLAELWGFVVRYNRGVSTNTRACIFMALAGFGSSCIFFASNLQAGTIDAIYAFGDSLTDVGNIYAASGGTVPGAPYVNGQFTNSSVWVQDLASGLGLGPLTPSLVGGTDYAYGTGETGVTSFNTSAPGTDLLGAAGQLAQFQTAHATADPNALYTIWIGANDLSDILDGQTPAQFGADIGAVAANIDTAISALASIGAKNFLIVTVPDLGNTPAALAAGPLASAGASALSAGFDTTLVNGAGPLPSLAALAAGDSISISVLNTYSLLDTIVADPAAFGFTNVTQACLTGEVNYSGGTPCGTPNQYLFWDQLHPTAAADVFVADAALSLVVPEPTSISLIALGLFGLVIVGRYCGRRSGLRSSTGTGTGTGSPLN